MKQEISPRNIIDVLISCSHLLRSRVLDSTFNISPCPEITIMYDIIGNTLINAMYVRISLNSNSH